MTWLPESPFRAAMYVCALFTAASLLSFWPAGWNSMSMFLTMFALSLTLAMAHKVTRNPKPTTGVLRRSRRQPDRDR